jgi:hypothetical protein
MKIYNRVVIDLSTGETIEEDSYEYDGPVMKCMGAAAIPIAVAVFSSVASVAAQKYLGPDTPDAPAMPGLEAPEEQPVEPKDNLMEQDMLASKKKRQQQGYLQSFGGLDELNTGFGLV